MTIVERVLARGAAEPGRLAFGFPATGEGLSAGDLARGARRAAGALAARGVRPGDRVCLLLPQGPDLPCLLFGAQLAGAIPVVMNLALPPEAIARRLAVVEADLAVVAPGAVASAAPAKPASPEERALPLAGALPPGLPRLGLALAEELLRGPAHEPPGAPRSDFAFLQLTSGTTGESRAAAITHASLHASTAGSLGAMGPTSTDVLVSWVPLYHDLGLVRFAFMSAAIGAACHLLPPSVAGIREWVPAMSRLRATITGAPDFGYRVAARAVDPRGIDLSSLRFATNGGEPVRASTIEAFEARFDAPGAVRPGYGLAEATLGVAVLRRGEPMRVDPAGHVSCGRALPGIEVRIAREDGGPAAPGETGAIEVRGEVVFTGYWGDLSGSRARLVSPEGWLRTGDTGALDADGHLYVAGRTRSMIKRAGALVAPRELEEAADRVAGVRLSAAVGVPREDDGTEDVVVVAELRDAAPPAEEARRALVDAISREVARAAGFAPGEVRLCPPRGIPLTANGKIRHEELRRLIREGRLPG